MPARTKIDQLLDTMDFYYKDEALAMEEISDTEEITYYEGVVEKTGLPFIFVVGTKGERRTVHIFAFAFEKDGEEFLWDLASTSQELSDWVSATHQIREGEAAADAIYN